MINAVLPIKKGNQGKNEEVQFWAEYKFGRNKEIVRFLIRNSRIVKRVHPTKSPPAFSKQAAGLDQSIYGSVHGYTAP